MQNGTLLLQMPRTKFMLNFRMQGDTTTSLQQICMWTAVKQLICDRMNPFVKVNCRISLCCFNSVLTRMAQQPCRWGDPTLALSILQRKRVAIVINTVTFDAASGVLKQLPVIFQKSYALSIREHNLWTCFIRCQIFFPWSRPCFPST